MDRLDRELRYTIRKIWPAQSKKLLPLLVPCKTGFWCYYCSDGIKPKGIIFIHADDSHGNKAFSSVCLWFCVSVCVCVRTITHKRMKLWTQSVQIWYRKRLGISYKWHDLHRVTKCKKAIEWRREFALPVLVKFLQRTRLRLIVTSALQVVR